MIRGFRRSRLAVDVGAVSTQILGAINANAAVMASVNALTLTGLPALQKPPSWWTTFTTNWTAAQTTALQWVETIGPDFSSIPQSIANYDALFQANVGVILSACVALEQNPKDSSAIASLTSALNALNETAQSESSLATQFASEIGLFAGQLTSSAVNLNAVLQQALNAPGVNRGGIEALQTIIVSLQASIAEMGQLLPPEALGTASSLYLMCSGIGIDFAGVGEGEPLLLGAASIGLTPSIINAVNSDLSIQQLQQEITVTSGAMSALSRQVAMLAALDGSLNALITLANEAQQSVAAMAAVWTTLQAGLAGVSSALAAGQQQSADANWQQVSADVTEAQTDWNALQAMVVDLGDVAYNASTTVSPIPAV